MNKVLFLLSIAFIAIAGFIFFIIPLVIDAPIDVNDTQQPVSNDRWAPPTEPVDPVTELVMQPEDGIVLNSDNGPVSVRDFLNDPAVVRWSDDTYVIRDNQGPNGYMYQMFYFPADNNIRIILQSEPLATARYLAEEELLLALGVDQATACDLDVFVATTIHVSETYSGYELGLSFCPGSVVLP